MRGGSTRCASRVPRTAPRLSDQAGGKAMAASLLFSPSSGSCSGATNRLEGGSPIALLQQKGLIPHQWRQVAGNVEVRLLGLVTLLLLFMLTYGWLTLCAWPLFPRPGPGASGWGFPIFALCGDMLEGMIAAMPGLVTVLLIVLITRFFIRVLAILFGDRIERGQLRVQGCMRRP